MPFALDQAITITTKTAFLTEQSEPEQQRFAFSYTIAIKNNAPEPIQLLNRHWLITDANGKKIQVEGIGVIGQQPIIKPNSSFKYTSGAVIETPVGTMEGYYGMQYQNNQHHIAIPVFRLAVPGILN